MIFANGPTHYFGDDCGEISSIQEIQKTSQTVETIYNRGDDSKNVKSPNEKWVVIGRSATTAHHGSEQLAKDEAKRLSGLNPGQTFYVAQIVSECKAEKRPIFFEKSYR